MFGGKKEVYLENDIADETGGVMTTGGRGDSREGGPNGWLT